RSALFSSPRWMSSALGVVATPVPVPPLLGGGNRVARTFANAQKCACGSGASSRAEKLVELGVGRCAGQRVEAAVAQYLLRSLHERAPGRARQRAADADAPHAECSKLGRAKPSRARAD